MADSAAKSQRIIHGHEIESEFLGETRTIKVFVPPGAANSDADTTRYPVLYCHDGNEFFTHGRIVTLATQLMEAGELEPIFIVALAVNMKRRTADYAPTGERQEAYTRFVLEEAVPLVESQYPITEQPEQRFMAGISLGAAATMSIHLQAPEQFKRLLLFSGAFYEALQQRIEKIPRFDDLVTYMVVGRQETAVDTPDGHHNFYQYNLQMRDLLRLRGAQVDYQEEDGTHIWGFWQSLIPNALRWLNRQLPR